MGLREYEIEDNHWLRERNRKAIERMAAVGRTDRPHILTGVVHPWNPGFHMGTHVKTRARPVKNSLSIDGIGRYIFEIEGDSKIDFTTKTGLVDEIRSHVSIDPLEFADEPSSWNPSCYAFRQPEEMPSEEEFEKERIADVIRRGEQQTKSMEESDYDRYRSFSLWNMRDFEDFKDRKSVSERELGYFGILFANDFEERQFMQKMDENDWTFEQAVEDHLESESVRKRRIEAAEGYKPAFEVLVNSGNMLSIEGIYSRYSQAESCEGTAVAMGSAFGFGSHNRGPTIVHASSIGVDKKLDDALKKLDEPRYKLNQE